MTRAPFIIAAVLGLPIFIAAAVFGPTAFDLVFHRRRPERFLIPAGYSGWVRVDFRQKNAPPLPMEDTAAVCSSSMRRERCKLLPILSLGTAETIFSTTRAVAARRSQAQAFAKAAWSGRLRPWSTPTPRHRLNASSSGPRISIATRSTPPAKSPPASESMFLDCFASRSGRYALDDKVERQA